jgi:hypothetical protein
VINIQKKLDDILDILKDMMDELIILSRDGSGHGVYNQYGRSKGNNLYCIFGDIIITDKYIYISIHPSGIPKDLKVKVNKQSVTFIYKDKSKNIKLPCKIESLIKFDTKNNIIDIKMKR